MQSYLPGDHIYYHQVNCAAGNLSSVFIIIRTSPPRSPSPVRRRGGREKRGGFTPFKFFSLFKRDRFPIFVGMIERGKATIREGDKTGEYRKSTEKTEPSLPIDNKIADII